MSHIVNECLLTKLMLSDDGPQRLQLADDDAIILVAVCLNRMAMKALGR